jgi:hypothetical protein
MLALISLEMHWPLRLLVEGIADYAIFMLDPAGFVTSWRRTAKFSSPSNI